MDELGILVYCIANRYGDELREVAGLDGLHNLYAVESRGLYAIASSVSLDDFGEEKMAEKGEDIEWLREKAQIFMDIILKINETASIVPMKFMTIFTGEDRVKAMLEENYSGFISNFQKIEGREEYSVKIYCSREVFKEKIMGEEIRAFEKTLTGKAKGAAFFLKKKFLTELDDKMQEKIYRKSESFTDLLKDCAADMKSNRLLAKEMTGVDTPMVLNCAFLLDTEKKDRFLQIVKTLADENEKNGFRVEASGPWPPYSFCQ